MNKYELNSRQTAFNILKKVFKNGSFSNILLNEVSSDPLLEQKQKNLIFAIVHGTITRKIFLEYTTNKLIDKKRTPMDIQIILWMSLYQMHYMDNIPEYAIVNESVELARTVNEKFSGMVNGVLKNIIKNKETIYRVDINNDDRRFCVENSFPFKLFTIIKDGYGTQKAKEVAIDSTKKPEINFRVNTIKTTAKEVFETYGEKYGLIPTKEIDNCFESEKPIIKTPLYQEGYITIQDKASVLVGQTLDPKQGSRTLDMCSAPGGKLTHLAALMKNEGEIVAYELSNNRIKLLEDNLERLGVNIVDLRNDNANNAVNDKPYDYILLDAPCSGFGVLKRKPEIKLNIDTEYLKTLYQIQSELLETAYKSLVNGGEMVYSTCTINLDENENQINKFIKNHNDMEILFKEQLFGNEMNSDGFFICKLRKKD